MDDPPRIAGFEIQGRLGAGAGGTVYRAYQVSLGRHVALKILREPLGHDSLLHRFRQEARSLARMSHPGIVRILEFEGAGDHPFIAMEYLSGGSLRDRLDREKVGEERRGIPLPEVQKLSRDLLLALATLHDNGVLHRDIKPSNILIRDTGEAVLADLGLAKSMRADETRMTRAGDLVGTAAYIAPELWSGADYDIRSDLFALGVVIFELLTGHHPNGYQPMSQDFVAPDPGAHSAAAEPFREFVRSLMASDPTRRPVTAHEALQLLAESSRPRRRSQRKITVVTVPIPPKKSRTVPLVSGVLIACLAVGGGFWHFRPRPTYTLSAQAQERAAVLVVRQGLPEMILRVRDVAGIEISRTADTIPEGIRFSLDHLKPGMEYRAQVHENSASDRIVAKTTFQTRPTVTVIGLDDTGDVPAVWLSVDPPAQVRPLPGGPSTRVSSTATRVLLSRPAIAGSIQLEVQCESGVTGTLTLTAHRAAKTRGLREVGIGTSLEKGVPLVKLEHDRIPLDRWMKDEGLIWLSPEVGDTSTAATLRERLAAWDQAANLQVLLEFRGTRGLATAREIASADAGPVRRSAMRLGLYHQWSWDIEDPDAPAPRMQEVPTDDQLEALVQKCSASADVDVPLNLGRLVTGAIVVQKGVSNWLQQKGGLLGALADPNQARRELAHIKRHLPGAVVSPLGTDAVDTWQWTTRILNTASGNANAAQSVRWSWTLVPGNVLDPAHNSRDDLHHYATFLVRSFTLSRAFFDHAAVMFKLGQLFRFPGGTVTPAWYSIRAVGRAISGMTFHGLLARNANAPRVSPDVGVDAFAFADESHCTQVFFARGAPVLTTFTPRAPGVLTRVEGLPPERTQGKTYTTTDPITLSVDENPLVYQELDPVSATFEPRSSPRP